ncbi:ligand-binding sensor domain-containing diguanylate cyclase [Dokdonella sp. MW10]|uniref:ligand-binding sensor domain-containing diguanylate cyclase n=1 Tax=Dokdonella sp. MW10 TaxID=2992926 RepID=UPI003F7E92E6
MSRVVACVVLVSGLLVAVWTAARAEPVRPLDLQDLGAPTFTNFSPRDGLPDAVTVAARTDRDGFVWVASPAGVARYDGRRWMPSDDPRMAHGVDALFTDHDGTLWAGFRQQGIARYDGRRWHVEDAASGLPSQQIRRFAETTDEAGVTTLWALTWDLGLMRHDGGRWSADPGNASLPRGPVLGFARTRTLGGAARQWAGTGNDGLWYRDEGTFAWTRWHAEGFDAAQVEYLLATTQANHEALWISGFGAGLWRLDDEGLRAWSLGSGELPTNDLYDIAQTPLPGGDLAVWVASRSGLLRIHGDRVQVFDRRHGLPSDVVRGLDAWRSPNGEDALWLVTEAGVARTIPSANPWLTASLMGTRSTGVFAVLVEPDGHGGERLWVGANGDGLGLYEDGRWRHFTQATGDLPDAGVSLVVPHRGARTTHTHWIGLRKGHLLRMHDGPRFEEEVTPWPKLMGEAVLDVFERDVDGHEERWIALRQAGIHRWRDGTWTHFPAAGEGVAWRVNRIVEQIAADGSRWLWATTDRGLARFDGSRWDLLGRADGLPDEVLLGITLLDDGRGHPVLWIGSSTAGVIRVDTTSPRAPRILPADLPRSPDPTVYSVLRDSRGVIYVCTNNGVQQLVAEGSGYASSVSTRRDGMVHEECNTNAQFIDAHDRFWTGTLGGLTVHDPRRRSIDTQPKSLRIVGMQVDGVAREGDALDVSAGARAIDIEFALLSWQREGESRFRTQLVGYDNAPSDWTAQNNKRFNALPPGHYVLRIEGRDYAGNLSAPIELPVVIAARWWQQWWASVALGIALLLLGYAGALWRNHVLKAQRRALEYRVAARTAELHTANARLVELSYVDALTGLANRRRFIEALEHRPQFGAPDETTSLAFVDVDHFKACNDLYGHPAGDEALRAVATILRSEAPAGTLAARYGGEEFACLLPDTSIDAAIAFAERVRERVAACDITVPDGDRVFRITISAGVTGAVLHDADDTRRLLADADAALYAAKRSGRDRVAVLEGNTIA